jgi:type IV pilus assembly protein PilE
MISRTLLGLIARYGYLGFPRSSSRSALAPLRSESPHGRQPIRLAKSQAGFTLVELLIAVVIIGILSAVAIPGYRAYVARAHQQEARRELTAIAQAQEIQRFKFGVYTATLATLTGLGWTGQTNSQFYGYVLQQGVDASGVPWFTATATGKAGTDVVGDQWVGNQDGTCSHNGGTCN